LTELSSIDKRRVILACAEAIAAKAQWLTELDQAIGDGDHGLNLNRGFAAVAAIADELAALPPGQALQKAGMALVMKVGGASGPLYGSLLMAMGKAAGDAPAIDLALLARMADSGVAAVKARGKSDVGAKTMLEVLVPVAQALGEAGADPRGIAARLRQVARAGRDSTVPMRATKGRASFLGERSIGHLDPGAASSCLLVETMCDALEPRETDRPAE
jgi:dihydroxyacetone kinase-like protein